MIDANKELFSRLNRFCAERNAPVLPSAGYRYVEGDDESDDVIRRLTLINRILFGFQRMAVHASMGDDEFLVLIGYEHLDDFVNDYSEFGEDVEQIDCLPGHVVVLLSELDIRPVRSGIEVRDYVTVADSETSDYEGHEIGELLRLLPVIAVFRTRFSLNDEAFKQLVAKFSAAESAYGGGWIDTPFLRDLLALSSLSARTFPYEAVSRAVFDPDPRNMYLALYRCIEATYAYKTSTDLARLLGVTMPWSELALHLDQTLSWRPREAASLEVVLSNASRADLQRVLTSMGKLEVDDDVVSAAPAAASAIYKLRNRIVHFGASRDSVPISSYDWNAVCSALVGVVFDVFHRAFDPIET